MSLEQFQKAMKQAVLGGDKSLAAAQIHGDGLAPEARIQLHANNTVILLAEALGRIFPAVKALLGEAAFDQVARAFAKAHPPTSPVLNAYGDGFADWLAGQRGLENLPYIGDVAALDFAWARAEQAADARAISIDVLSVAEPSVLDDIRFRLHPAFGLVLSDWPIFGIWSWARSGGQGESPFAGPEPSATLVNRQVETVEVIPIPMSVAHSIRLLLGGASLGEAAGETSVAFVDFNPGLGLHHLFSAGLVVQALLPESRPDTQSPPTVAGP
ncbi:MAG: putative DNA-binding domain-containing protein [Magnetovibrionaceae bacterium]